MSTLATTQAFDIGRVIARLFGVLSRNLLSFAMLSVLLVGVPTAAANMLQLNLTSQGANPSGDTAAITFGLIMLAYLVSLLGNAVLQGSLIHGTVTDLAGRRASFSESLGAGMRHFLILIGIGIIAVVCVFFGFLLLIVPGVLLSLAWSVAAPAAVMERVGVFGAFGRSVELTRNNRAAIFGLAVILFVVQFIVQFAVVAVVFLTVGLGSAASLGPGAVVVAQTISTLIAQTIIGALSAAGVASVYYELRQIKEGVGAAELAAVFD